MRKIETDITGRCYLLVGVLKVNKHISIFTLFSEFVPRCVHFLEFPRGIAPLFHIIMFALNI